jgi:hypothetical protein
MSSARSTRRFPKTLANARQLMLNKLSVFHCRILTRLHETSHAPTQFASFLVILVCAYTVVTGTIACTNTLLIYVDLAPSNPLWRLLSDGVGWLFLIFAALRSGTDTYLLEIGVLFISSPICLLLASTILDRYRKRKRGPRQ